MAQAYLNSPILNPSGARITIPNWVKRELSKIHQLQWNKEQRLWQIKPSFLDLLPLFEGPNFRPTPYHAQNMNAAGGRPRQSGYASKLLQALGSDLSGLNTPANEEIEEMQSDLDNARLSGERGRQVVALVKSQREEAA